MALEPPRESRGGSRGELLERPFAHVFETGVCGEPLMHEREDPAHRNGINPLPRPLIGQGRLECTDGAHTADRFDGGRDLIGRRPVGADGRIAGGQKRVSWIVGVDVGGTFTDFYAVGAGDGEIRVAKRPSTRDNPGRAVIEGLDELSAAGVPLGDVRRLAHGTTVATNAIIQRRGGRVILLTTAGFRDLLEIGRQTRPHMFDLYRDQPPPLVPRERRIEVDERVTAGGRVVRALGQRAIREATAALGGVEADACAVCLLFSFQHPDHEERLGAAVRAARPDLRVSLSSEVQPEFREFERCSTTVLNAWLQPVMDEYMASLEAGLHDRIPAARIGINQSNGGLMSPARARAFPVRTALSGPAAGVVGAIDAGALAGLRDLITLDMGGTSADVSLVRDLKADIALERGVAGLPIRLPGIDVHTVGAGGGSIAWFDRDGLLKVGPESAGADPGPACYGRGGAASTVTDANLLLGRLSTRGLLGGRMALDRNRSAEAFSPIARQLGYSVERTAHGVLGIVVANMVRAIRTISVERGHDPRDFALVAFGGAGPLHARDVAEALGIRDILVPAVPGIVCAQGLVIADRKEDFVLGRRVALDPGGAKALAELVAALAARADAWFAGEAVADADREVELYFDSRYVGQNFELRVPVAAGGPAVLLAPLDIEAIKARFFQVHDTAYGYHDPADAVEVVNVRLTAFGRTRRTAAEAAALESTGLPEPAEVRPVWFGPDRPHDTPVFDRNRLRAGAEIAGPAIVEQLDATTVVYPGDRARADAHANLLIRLDGA